MACGDIRFRFGRLRFSLLVDPLGHAVDHVPRAGVLLIALAIADITGLVRITGSSQADVFERGGLPDSKRPGEFIRQRAPFRRFGGSSITRNAVAGLLHVLGEFGIQPARVHAFDNGPLGRQRLIHVTVGFEHQRTARQQVGRYAHQTRLNLGDSPECRQTKDHKQCGQNQNGKGQFPAETQITEDTKHGSFSLLSARQAGLERTSPR